MTALPRATDSQSDLSVVNSLSIPVCIIHLLSRNGLAAIISQMIAI
jgi:hypothetical protein